MSELADNWHISDKDKVREYGAKIAKLEAEVARLRGVLEQQEKSLPKVRKRIADVLKGGIVYANDQWSKGYCAGVTAALTGFDDGVKLAERALGEKEKKA